MSRPPGSIRLQNSPPSIKPLRFNHQEKYSLPSTDLDPPPFDEVTVPNPFHLTIAASLTTLFTTLFMISSFLSLYKFTHWKPNHHHHQNNNLTDQCTIILFFLTLISSSALMAVLRQCRLVAEINEERMRIV